MAVIPLIGLVEMAGAMAAAICAMELVQTMPPVDSRPAERMVRDVTMGAMDAVKQVGRIAGDVTMNAVDAVQQAGRMVGDVTRAMDALLQQGGRTATEGRTSTRLSVKQMEAITEAMKRAYTSLLSYIEVADREQPRRALVASGMGNTQHRTLKLYDSGSLSGKFVVKPQKTMVEGGLFLHQGPDPDDSNPADSKAYVIYGTSDNDRPCLLYLLAWSKPANGSRNKVYVQAGLWPNMLKLLANEIEQKLNAYGDSDVCYSYDPETGAEAAAIIKNVFDGQLALLGAIFSRREL